MRRRCGDGAARGARELVLAVSALLPPEFWPVFVAGCARLEVDPVELLSVAANESGCDPRAWNAGGRAAGLFQMTPVAAPGMGWDPHDTHAFCALSAVDQWPYWERYFRPHRGRLVSRAACYLCTFLPALLDLAGEPDALLCSRDGRTHASQAFARSQVISWYEGNRGFDRTRTGEIHVRDLTAAIDRSTLALGGVWSDYVAAIHREQALRDTNPDITDGGRDRPIYVVPEPPDRDPEAA